MIKKIDLKQKINNLIHRIIRLPLPVIFFVIFALLCGSLFIKNVGSFSGPDLYTAHYRAALAAATGQSFSEPKNSAHGRVQYLAGEEEYFASGKDCIQNSLVSGVVHTPLESDKMRGCIANYDASLTEGEQVKVMAILQYPPITYAPQAIGLGFGMIVNMEPLASQTIARFLNLFTYIAMIALSIAIIPRGKWLVVVLGLLPTSLFLASSFSPDGLNIAWSFLFVSYILRLYVQKQHIKPLQVAIIVTLGIGLFMLKVAYAPLMLLILALRKNVISTKNKVLLFASTLVVGAGLYGIWSANWSSLNATVDTSSNMSMILQNLPEAVIGILINILYLPMMLFTMPQTTYIAAAILIIAMLVVYLRSITLIRPSGLVNFIDKYRMQVLAILATFGSLGLTYAALLLTWTDIGLYGWLEIQGFQGRYVLPLLPLLLTIYFMPAVSTPKTGKKGKL